MATATDRPQHVDSNTSNEFETKVSSYDRVSGLLVALLALVGFGFVLLFLIWLTTVMTFKKRAVPVKYIEELSGRGAAAEGIARDFEEPGIEELADVTEPQLSETLEAVTDAVSSQSAALEAFEGNAAKMGTGSGLGDGRAAGPGGEGTEDIIPRWERWEVQFQTTSVEEYAKQLDHFDIELGAVGGGSPQVDYAKNLSKGSPDTRAGPGDEEKRLYMTWAGGVLQQMDRQLLSKAGINSRRRVIMQFYSADAENTLAGLELEYAKGRHVREIRKTVFGVRKGGSGYEFYVIDQKYRNVPA